MTDPAGRAWRALLTSPREGRDLLGSQVDPWSQWARGALHLSQGDFAAAFTILGDVAVGLDDPDGDREVAGLASARIASGLRQLDEHDAAVTLDERACAGGGQAVVDGLIGLAADAVGRADADGARRHLDAADDLARGWRDDVRIRWVATEIALLRGRAGDAEQHAAAALREAEMQGSARHRVKSGLFWGAAARRRHPGESLRVLRRALTEAIDLGLAPFVWPAVEVLAEEATAAEEGAADRAVRSIATRLPAGHGHRWLRRPDISARLEALRPNGGKSD